MAAPASQLAQGQAQGLTSTSCLPFPAEAPPQRRSSTAATSQFAATGSRACRPSRPPSPIRTLSQLPSRSRATSTATSTINATGSSFSRLTQHDREAQAKQDLSQPNRTATSTDSASEQSLKAHQEEIDASPRRRLHPTHSRSYSAGPKAPDKVVMLQVTPQHGSNPAMSKPAVRRSASHRPSRSPSMGPSHAEPKRQVEEGRSSGAEDREVERRRLKSIAEAKLAEQEAWERTRGAGSDVLNLLGAKSEEDCASGSNDSAGGAISSGASILGDPDVTISAIKNLKLKRKARDHVWDASDVLPPLEELQSRKHKPTFVSSADKLLSRGISDYTLLPRILGRGKFSTVYLASKPSGPNGAPQLFAVKHTPLFPHHPLIATRLLREPTLLAELPPHPNLVNVYETIRTPGHFYLVEEYLENYVTLEALLSMRSERAPPQPPCLSTDVANCVLDQLIIAVQAIHHPLQICHRDIKPENILVHPETLQLKLLDFGLATHYSKSEPKLTTCCGSPAFHSPEIVTALRNPPGSIRYWGPEVDAWTCGITMLRLLTGVRYPIGASHTSVRSMSIRAQRAVATIRDPELRSRVGKLLDANGEQRIKNFKQLVAAVEQEHGEVQRGRKEFKSSTYIPTAPQHSMNLPLVVGPAAEAALKQPVLPSGSTPTASCHTSPASSRAPSPFPERLTSAPLFMQALYASPAPSLIISNPERQPPQRVLSFIKYCLRCAGILYHCWPDTSLSGLRSTPSTPGPWEVQLADLHEQALSGLQPSINPGIVRLEALGAGNNGSINGGSGDDSTPPPSLSPATPFSFQAERSERDPFLHVHIFECVLEMIEEPPEENDRPPSLVQTIMSALTWGRRPANRRALSTPSKPDEAIRNPATQARSRAMSKPLGQPAETPASGSGGPSSKSEKMECLRFYLVVRFPRKAVGTSRRRPGYSRSVSRTAASDRNKMRSVSRVGSTENLTHRITQLIQYGADGDGDGSVASQLPPLESNGTTPKASRTASPSTKLDMSVAMRGDRLGGRSVHQLRPTLGASLPDAEPVETQDLTIETSPELLRKSAAISAAQALTTESASTPASRHGSRAPSRSRKDSRVRSTTATSSSKKPVCDKVLVHVTDARALEAVRKALSVGGTTDGFAPDVEVDVAEQQPCMGQFDRSIKEALLAENAEKAAATSQTGVSRPRRPSARRNSSYGSGGEARRSQRPKSIASIDEVADVRQQQQKANWMALQPSGSMRARTTVSAGSDDPELLTRGRPIGVARSNSSHPSATHHNAANVSNGSGGGIPFPSRRSRAPSQLSAMVLHEESPTKNSNLSQTNADLVDPKAGVQELEATSANEPAFGAAPGGDGQGVESPANDGNDDLNARTVRLIGLTERLDGMNGSAVGLPVVGQLGPELGAYAAVLDRLKARGDGSLAEQLDALSFEVFKALSPALGLVHANGNVSRLHDDAARSFAIIAKDASSRELYMAIDLRCNALLQTEVALAKRADGDAANLVWTPAAEALGLVRLLATVVPRIRTKKPQSFSSVFTLLPKLIGVSLGRTANVASHEAGRSLSREMARACCTLILAVAEWEARCNRATADDVTDDARERTGYKLSQEALAPFLAAISNLLPHLQRSGSVGLVEAYFRRSLPRYHFARPGEAERQTTINGNDDDNDNNGNTDQDIWAHIAETISQLEVDLACIWTSALQSIGHASFSDGGEVAASPSGDEAEQSERRLRSTLAVGGFQLHVHLLARGLVRDGPATWSASTAQKNLQQVLPLLTLALGTEMKHVAAPPELSEVGREVDQLEGPLSSASLLWLLWCMGALKAASQQHQHQQQQHLPELAPAPASGRTQLDDALVAEVAQVLAAHMPISPSPTSRHARLQALHDLVCHHADRKAALRTLRDLIQTSPFGQVRAACIGVLRAFWTLAWQLPDGNDQEKVDMLESAEARQLASDLFASVRDLAMPLSSPSSERDAADQKLAAFLQEKAAEVQETAGLLYLISVRDREAARRRPLIDGAAAKRWLEPLVVLCEAWERHISSTAKTTTSPQALGIEAQLRLLAVNLERAQGAL
ncbi:hypothetical protein ACQY0O_002549 [Thecaphora frezii]